MKQCRFERHCDSSSPAHAETGEEEVSLPCNAPSQSFPRLVPSLTLPTPACTVNTPKEEENYAMQWQGSTVQSCLTPPRPAPWQDKASSLSLPLAINTERYREKRRGGEEGQAAAMKKKGKPEGAKLLRNELEEENRIEKGAGIVWERNRDCFENSVDEQRGEDLSWKII